MSCNGSVKLRTGDRNHVINALITDDIKDKFLISWHDLQAIGVIPLEFPSRVFLVDTVLDATAVKEELKRSYSDVLNDDLSPGQAMSRPAMKIHLNDSTKIIPACHSIARKIPLHLQEHAERVVNDLIQKGVLQKVDIPTQWTMSDEVSCLR
jgi:hypothetical protein